MFVFVSVLLALCHHSLSAYPHENKGEKPLFVPTFNYATLVHLNPLSYGSSHSLENTALYPQYVYDHGSHEYLDSFQRQLPYQDIEKRLGGFLYAGTKPPKKHHDLNEDDYKLKPNNILNPDDIKPELDDLDLKFKRSLTYTSWTPPSLSSTNNLEDRGAPSNSRAVPFGPYTTWSPYEGPLITGYAAQNVKPTKSGGRRRREIVYDNHLPLASSPSVIPPDYTIPVPISYASPIIRSVPFIPNMHSSPAAVVAPNTFYTGKLTASLDTIAQNTDPVSYNVVNRK